ncbi:tr [Leptolyngbya sp. Heron Island J]|uniref:hypothetical protein n=1 Tax=Leptolyngbya sp. Heron Island J TaxID=1385935 RepID=UPI0003B93A21|nr:hypothetical protein [Leptolyngbya sp. Heron Island J]ESA38906.1 tr [Leptolyngbya sp. Heron Island J]
MNYYYFFTPPYFFMVAGLFIAITSGAAFSAVLKEIVAVWRETRSSAVVAKLGGLSIQLPFLGICTGTAIFLASGLGCFGTPTWLSYAAAVPLTFLSAGLVWRQLKSNLALLESGQARAFELDFFS